MAITMQASLFLMFRDLCMCTCWSHPVSPTKMAEPIEMPFVVWTWLTLHNHFDCYRLSWWPVKSSAFWSQVADDWHWVKYSCPAGAACNKQQPRVIGIQPQRVAGLTAWTFWTEIHCTNTVRLMVEVFVLFSYECGCTSFYGSKTVELLKLWCWVSEFPRMLQIGRKLQCSSRSDVNWKYMFIHSDRKQKYFVRGHEHSCRGDMYGWWNSLAEIKLCQHHVST